MPGRVGLMDESVRLNRANWDERAPAHAASPDYGIDRYLGLADRPWRLPHTYTLRAVKPA